MHVLIKSIYVYNIYIYIYIYTSSFYLKVAVREETSKLIFNIFWDVLWQFCYQIQSQVLLWLLHICLFEIQGQIVWLIHCRDSFAWNTKANSSAWMFESCILPSLITQLNFWTKNCVPWIVVGSKKLSGNMWLYSWVR